ncbi:UNVERIFIED_CONTAM: putative E3 ubiquitin-protein ligase herc4, partial [Siphonaria sp. JEL0065]
MNTGDNQWHQTILEWGQLGHPKHTKLPARVDALDTFNIKSVSCGKSFTVVLTTCGKVLSFGANECGQLGHSFDKKIGKPRAVKFIPVARIMTQTSPKIVAIASGSRHSLLLSEDGSVWGFGDGYALGGAMLVKELYGIPIKQVVCVEVSAGSTHCAAINTDGKCFVWGSGSHGQIASGTPCFTSPVALTRMDGDEFGAVSKVVCGRAHTILLTKRSLGDGSDSKYYQLYSFGCNDMGQLGNGNFNGRNSVDHVHLETPLDVDLSHVLYAGPGDQMVLISSPIETRKPLAHDGLTLTEIQELVYSVEANNSSTSGTLLVSKLQLNLFSLSRLNSSFLSANHLSRDGRADPNVSVKDIKEAFALLASMKNSKWAPQIHKLLYEASVTSPSLVMPSPDNSKINVTPESLRGFFILFENPLLVSNKDNLESIRRLANVINDLTDTQKKVLEHWWISNPYLLSSFQTVVAAFNKALSFYTLKRLETPTIAALRVLKWLWTINNRPFEDDDPLQFSYSQKTSTSLVEIPDSASTACESIPPPPRPQLPSFQPFSVPTSGNIANMMSVLGALGPTPTIEVQLTPENLAAGMPTQEALAVMAAQAFTRQMESLFKDANEISLGERPSPRTLIPHSCFINDSLSKRIDFKSDFLVFYASTRPNVFGPESGLENVFAFCNYPFVLSLGARMILLGLDAQRQQTEYQSLSLMRYLQDSARLGSGDEQPQQPAPEPETVHNVLQVRRGHLLHDAFKAIGKVTPANLKKPLKVKFVGEIGVDGGGVSREFMDLFFRRVVKHSDMFVDVDSSGGISAEGVMRRGGYVWFNHLSKRPVKAFKTVGRIFGLALFNNCMVSMPFPPVLFKRLLGWPATLEDLADLQPSTAKWLTEMLAHEDASTFEETFYGLEFSVTTVMRRTDEKDALVEPYKNELLPGEYAGKPVTFENRGEYVKAMIQWHTGGSVEGILIEFRTGFLEACGGPVLDQLLPNELEVLLKGKDEDVANFKDLQTVAKYKAPYHKEHPVIKRFWSVFHALPVEFKYKFLKFITGTDTVPALRGLKEVQIIIQPSGAGAGPRQQQEQQLNETGMNADSGTVNPGTGTPAGTTPSVETAPQTPTPRQLPAPQQPPEFAAPRIPGILADVASLFSSPLPIPSSPRQMLDQLLSMFGTRPGTPRPQQPPPEQDQHQPQQELAHNLEYMDSDSDDEDGDSDYDPNYNSENETDPDLVNQMMYSPEYQQQHFQQAQHPRGQVIGSMVLDFASMAGGGSSSSSSGTAAATAATAVESSSGPLTVGGSSSNVAAPEVTRGKKRGREEDEQDDVDDWEPNADAVRMEQDEEEEAYEDVAFDQKGKGPMQKKQRQGNSPVKKKSASFSVSQDGAVLDWKKSVVLDLSLNEPNPLKGVDEQRLPVAHTCAFVLDLPAYQSVEKLMDRLVFAV